MDQPRVDETTSGHLFARLVEDSSAYLILVSAPVAGAYVLSREVENVIGRGPTARIRVDDQGISRAHAVVSWQDTGWQLSDLGSKNGTWVNGERVSSAKLREG